MSKELFKPKFLQKLKDSALDQRFEPTPKGCEDYWVESMWLTGLLYTLEYFGYEIRKKDD